MQSCRLAEEDTQITLNIHCLVSSLFIHARLLLLHRSAVQSPCRTAANTLLLLPLRLIVKKKKEKLKKGNQRRQHIEVPHPAGVINKSAEEEGNGCNQLVKPTLGEGRTFLDVAGEHQ